VYQRKDAYYAKAKHEGYRSRAAYKLLELDRTYRLFRPGDGVVDLGCWPGGWLQVASRLVGARGRVVGVDLVAVSPLKERNVATICGDAADPRVRERALELLGRQADVVVSDIAPKLSGIKETDEARALALVRAGLEFARAVLRPGGKLVVKAFMGADLRRFIDEEVRGGFESVAAVRPKATREGSAEVYLVARGFRPQAGRN
jgi:23S rRNA (uridine2552-2'-O)-methyltransferase